ncbi:hypothetical protein ACNSO7_24415 [Yersinia enterocolitica]|uniref:hypothetical protein n=1 Tax=Yersinia enterocolitica TaxID=630 RepID=UPI00398D01BA
MSWYRAGEIAGSAGNAVITGVNTNWIDNKQAVGAGQALIISVGDATQIYEIEQVESATQIRLTSPLKQDYSGEYAILTFYVDSVPDFARRLSTLIGYFTTQLTGLQDLVTSDSDVTFIKPDGTSVIIPSIHALTKWVDEYKKWFDTAREGIDNAATNASEAKAGRDEAEQAKLDAITAATGAEEYAQQAEDYAEQAGTRAQSAASSENNAATSATAAAESQNAAAESEKLAVSSANSATLAAQNAQESKEAAQQAAQNAQNYCNKAEEIANNLIDELQTKAPLDSPALTGTPTAPTPELSATGGEVATAEFVKQAVSALVSSSPETLDTLKELADALGNDPNFATTMTNALADKQPLNPVLTSLSGLATAGDQLPYFSDPNVMALTGLSAIGRVLIGQNSKNEVLEYLEVEKYATDALCSTAGNAWGSPDVGGLIFAAYCGESDDDNNRKLIRGKIVAGSRLGMLSISAKCSVSGAHASSPQFMVASPNSYPQAGTFAALSGSTLTTLGKTEASIGLFIRIA